MTPTHKPEDGDRAPISNGGAVLKPCPFCGGQARIKSRKTTLVDCETCGAAMLQLLGDRNSAKLWWNTRTDATALLAEKAQRIERLEALLREYLDIRDEAASIDDVLPDQSIKAWACLAERQNTLTICARAALSQPHPHGGLSPR